MFFPNAFVDQDNSVILGKKFFPNRFVDLDNSVKLGKSLTWFLRGACVCVPCAWECLIPGMSLSSNDNHEKDCHQTVLSGLSGMLFTCEVSSMC